MEDIELFQNYLSPMITSAHLHSLVLSCDQSSSSQGRRMVGDTHFRHSDATDKRLADSALERLVVSGINAPLELLSISLLHR